MGSETTMVRGGGRPVKVSELSKEQQAALSAMVIAAGKKLAPKAGKVKPQAIPVDATIRVSGDVVFESATTVTRTDCNPPDLLAALFLTVLKKCDPAKTIGAALDHVREKHRSVKGKKELDDAKKELLAQCAELAEKKGMTEEEPRKGATRADPTVEILEVAGK